MLQISDLKQSVDLCLKDINGYRMETTSLKLELESLRANGLHNGFSKADNQSSTTHQSIDVFRADVVSQFDPSVKDTYQEEDKEESQPSIVHERIDIYRTEVESQLDSSIKSGKDAHQQDSEIVEVSVARDRQNDQKGSLVSELDNSMKEKLNGVEMPTIENEHEDTENIGYENCDDHEGDQDAVVDSSVIMT